MLTLPFQLTIFIPEKTRTTKTNANEPSGYKLNEKGNCHIAM